MVEPMTRTLYFNSDVDNTALAEICQAIILVNKADNVKRQKNKEYIAPPIHLYVNSFGGWVDEMWNLISLIEASKTPVYTYCTGYAMSAGFMIFISGHKRFISRHARLMYHQLSGGNYGTYQDMRESIEESALLHQHAEEYVASHTNIPMKKLKEIRERKIDWYIRADEAIRLGCADEVFQYV